MPDSPLQLLLHHAFAARAPQLDVNHESACRLFNGFHEGEPDLAIDLYATTAVIHDYAAAVERGAELTATAVDSLRATFPWIDAIVVKARGAATPEERRGRLLLGERTATRIREHGVWYALDLTMNRDASLYLDTRELRRWAIEHLADKTVLNTFAYTGSLGVAALAGGATHVTQLDLNRRFLELARRSCALNRLDQNRHEIMDGDFFPRVAQLKRAGRLFDCVFLDPPFFATSSRGTVDLENNLGRLINKVRPLVAHDGRLVVVNNALYVSGAQFMAELEALGADGYVTIESLVPVSEDFTGGPATRVGTPVTDPAPFNHSTKIAILRITRKGARDPQDPGERP